MNSRSDTTHLLAQKGLKSTRQRNAVLRVLQQADEPLTVDAIFMQLRENQVPVSLATVYRMLDLFGEKGLVTKSVASASRATALYQLAGQHVTHVLRCMRCQTTVPIQPCPLDKLEEHLRLQTDFEIKGHHLEVYGLCPQCR
ncbi:MAG TPA: transcriptional repressor [Firmicutes bacterium]|jgi:Fur family ferric uptake transcriptional regulator|nr:transcriptional repressor [Bacillota bacterium]